MMTPYRGRGRDYGRGGRESNNMLPHPESNIPLIRVWTTYKGRKMQQLPVSSAKKRKILLHLPLIKLHPTKKLRLITHLKNKWIILKIQ
ncbi:unnamed protein product [Lathyrus sativus]|nr:unnamed protein product [Lathyrus sativus]